MTTLNRGGGKTTFAIIFAALAVALSAGLFGTRAFAAGDVRLTAQVNRTKIGVSETLQYVLTVEGARGRIEMPKPPDFASFDVINRFTQQSTQIINGRFSSSFNLVYQLLPKKAGKFTIGPGSFSFNGETYKSNSVTVEVLKGESKPQQQPAQRMTPSLNPEPQDNGITDNVYFKASVNKRRVTQNEPILLTYGFYRRIEIYSGNVEFPTYSGFWVEQLADKPELRETVVDGKSYLVQEWKKILFPTTAGAFDIGAAKLHIQASPYQPPYQLKTNVIKITVDELPMEGKPANFTGAVGQYKLQTTIDKKTAGVNEPINLRIKISGTGNINSFDDIKMEFPQDIDVYESKNNSKTFKGADRITGSRTFDYTILARNPGEFHIKPLEFVYFDYAARKYKTLKTNPITLKISGGGSGPGGQMDVVRETVKPLKRDINFIKNAEGVELRERGLRAALPFFAAAHLVPMALLGLVFLKKRKKEKFRNDVALARTVRARGGAAKRLRKARSLMRKGSEKQFFTELSAAINKYLADKMNVSAESLIIEDTLEKIKEQLGEAAPVADIREALMICDAARFSTAAPTHDDMSGSYDQAARIITELERIWKRVV